MKNVKIGFIGNGNMGSALATAVANADYPTMLYDVDIKRSKALAEKIGGKTAPEKDIINDCDFVFIGVKPQMLENLAGEIKPILAKAEKKPTLVSMAAGTPIDRILSLFGQDLKIIRIMPNTSVGCGQGMTVYAKTANVTANDEATFLDFMKKSGKVDALEEKFIDAASAVLGCGPAFVYMFIEALADGGVACGLPRNKALTYAAQTVLGSAENLITTGKHPGELKDAVCSPGGTTIEGVRALEEHGFRAAAISAVTSAYEKTLKL